MSGFVTKDEVTKYLKIATHDEMLTLVENAKIYPRTSEVANDVVFHRFQWDGTSESFKMIPEQIRDTELLLKSPELGWVSSIINHCYTLYDHYGIAQMDNLVLTMSGLHYLRIESMRAQQSGRSIVISYDAIRDSIASINANHQRISTDRWIKGGFFTVIALLVFIVANPNLKKLEWL